MCGICGFVGSEHLPHDRAAERRMCDVLAHRGPDGEGGADISGEASGRRLLGWFGHRRLKVIDLSDRADQPMANEDRSIVLTYNGEIYNFRELRAELAASGFRFRSTGDT